MGVERQFLCAILSTCSFFFHLPETPVEPKSFAQAVGASKKKIILLVLDRAGWHTSEKVVLPEGIILEPLPPYSPELQPAERLWALADEPLVNKSFETLNDLEAALSQRCQILSQMQPTIQALTNYHWWPDPEALETGWRVSF